MSADSGHSTSSRQHQVPFIKGGHLSSSVNPEHEHSPYRHSHPTIEDAGSYLDRERPCSRNDWCCRAFTVGIGGPVGSGKTALLLALCNALKGRLKLSVVTNDIFTREDYEFLLRNEALEPHQLAAVETGGCPHVAIREDLSLNLEEVKRLSHLNKPNIVFVESGGDNLAANFSRELADYIIYVIDVAGGDKIPRKGGPGITQSDLLIINKTDLADAVGASLKVMEVESEAARQGGPTIFAQARHNIGISWIVDHILDAYKQSTGNDVL